jgi:hypothetical protein
MNIPGTEGAILLDGARYDDALMWIYEQYPDHQPLPLLAGTPYELLAEAGPILLSAPAGSPAYQAWWQGVDLHSGLWLESRCEVDELFRLLQRRVRILSPDRREFWLRFADAQPMRNAWLTGAQWPEGFWHRIDSIWLHHEHIPTCAWRNQAPHIDCAPADAGLSAQVTLDWPMLEALAPQDVAIQAANA